MPREKELKKIVGENYVFGEPETLERYSKDESFVHPIRPRCVVKPKSLEEVQEKECINGMLIMLMGCSFDRTCVPTSLKSNKRG